MSKVLDMINEAYDINDSHVAKIDLDFEYENEDVVVIIGESGSGKTTLLRKWFEIEDVVFKVDNSKSVFEILYDIIDDFDETSKLLFDVGLASVPTWKNTYSRLSNGEKLRFEIAHKLVSDDKVIFIDEYTSMLDRQTAQNLTLNLNELLEKYKKKVILSTCHFDILDWMNVNKVVDTTVKKSRTHKEKKLITHTNWKSEVYQEICGEYLSTITI